MGQTYGILKKESEAVDYFNQCLTDENLTDDYKSVAYRYISVIEAENRNWRKALELINKSLEADPEQPLPLLVSAKLKVKLNDLSGAEVDCLKAYKVNRNKIESKGSTFQSIYLNESDILRECLSIAPGIGSLSLFNYFFTYIEQLKRMLAEHTLN